MNKNYEEVDGELCKTMSPYLHLANENSYFTSKSLMK